MTTYAIEQTYRTSRQNIGIAISTGNTEKIKEAIKQGIDDLYDAGSPDNDNERNAILYRSAQLEQMAPWYRK